MTCQEETGHSQMTPKVCPASQPFRLSFCASSKPKLCISPCPPFLPKGRWTHWCWKIISWKETTIAPAEEAGGRLESRSECWVKKNGFEPHLHYHTLWWDAATECLRKTGGALNCKPSSTEVQEIQVIFIYTVIPGQPGLQKSLFLKHWI